jgi:hypothetical protein
MSVIEGNIRKKLVLTVVKSRYSPAKGYTEYQLKSEDGQLYKGAWFREKDLRRDR